MGRPGRRTGGLSDPIKEAHEIDGSGGQKMLKVRFGYASIVAAPHAQFVSGEGDGAFNARAEGILFFEIVCGLALTRGLQRLLLQLG